MGAINQWLEQTMYPAFQNMLGGWSRPSPMGDPRISEGMESFINPDTADAVGSPPPRKKVAVTGPVTSDPAIIPPVPSMNAGGSPGGAGPSPLAVAAGMGGPGAAAGMAGAAAAMPDAAVAAAPPRFLGMQGVPPPSGKTVDWTQNPAQLAKNFDTYYQASGGFKPPPWAGMPTIGVMRGTTRNTAIPGMGAGYETSASPGELQGRLRSMEQADKDKAMAQYMAQLGMDTQRTKAQAEEQGKLQTAAINAQAMLNHQREQERLKWAMFHEANSPQGKAQAQLTAGLASGKFATPAEARDFVNSLTRNSFFNNVGPAGAPTGPSSGPPGTPATGSPLDSVFGAMGMPGLAGPPAAGAAPPIPQIQPGGPGESAIERFEQSTKGAPGGQNVRSILKPGGGKKPTVEEALVEMNRQFPDFLKANIGQILPAVEGELGQSNVRDFLHPAWWQKGLASTQALAPTIVGHIAGFQLPGTSSNVPGIGETVRGFLGQRSEADTVREMLRAHLKGQKKYPYQVR